MIIFGQHVDGAVLAALWLLIQGGIMVLYRRMDSRTEVIKAEVAVTTAGAAKDNAEVKRSDALTDGFTASQFRIDNQDKKLEVMQGEVTRLTGEVGVLQGKNDGLEKSNAAFDARVKSLEETAKKSEAKEDKYERRIFQLEQDLASARADLLTSQQTIREMAAEITALKQALAIKSQTETPATP